MRSCRAEASKRWLRCFSGSARSARFFVSSPICAAVQSLDCGPPLRNVKSMERLRFGLRRGSSRRIRALDGWSRSALFRQVTHRSPRVAPGDPLPYASNDDAEVVLGMKEESPSSAGVLQGGKGRRPRPQPADGVVYGGRSSIEGRLRRRARAFEGEK